MELKLLNGSLQCSVSFTLFPLILIEFSSTVISETTSGTSVIKLFRMLKKYLLKNNYVHHTHTHTNTNTHTHTQHTNTSTGETPVHLNVCQIILLKTKPTKTLLCSNVRICMSLPC